MRQKEHIIYSIKRKDGKIFSIGDKFTYDNDLNARTMVKGRVSNRKMRICGFEKHAKGYYVLYMPQYHNGVIEKKDPWRACEIESAIHIR